MLGQKNELIQLVCGKKSMQNFFHGHPKCLIVEGMLLAMTQFQPTANQKQEQRGPTKDVELKMTMTVGLSVYICERH